MDKLRQAVWKANQALRQNNLVYGTQGNVSGIDRPGGFIYIKPSGVAYEELAPSMVVKTDLTGKALSGALKPSVDTVHHLRLYAALPEVGGVCHTHSRFVTVFAVLGLAVPVFSTGHADVFGRDIPVTPYVDNTADAIGQALLTSYRKYRCPAIIIGKHGLFSVGDSPDKAAFYALMAEYCAETAYYALALGPVLGRKIARLSPKEIAKWYGRYHSSRYGQK